MATQPCVLDERRQLCLARHLGAVGHLGAPRRNFHPPRRGTPPDATQPCRLDERRKLLLAPLALSRGSLSSLSLSLCGLSLSLFWGSLSSLSLSLSLGSLSLSPLGALFL